MRTHGLGWNVLAGLLVAVPLLAAPPERHPSEPELAPGGKFPAAARGVVRTQMRAHAEGMQELQAAVTAIDFPRVEVVAERLLAEPRIARPHTNDATEINSALPARFFELQDDLRDNLRTLAGAAEKRDAEGLANAYGATARTCVRCHEAYVIGK
jgi:hypothetical protein